MAFTCLQGFTPRGKTRRPDPSSEPSLLGPLPHPRAPGPSSRWGLGEDAGLEGRHNGTT